MFDMEDWTGVSYGLNIGIGYQFNFGSLYGGMSNGKLLNNVIPTNERSLMDRFTNFTFPITSSVANYFR